MVFWKPLYRSETASIRASHFTLPIPYQPGTTSRRGKPCWGGRTTPATFVGEEHVGAEGLGHREAAGVVLLDALLNAPVEPGEDDLDGVSEQTSFLHDVPEGDARPLGGSHRLDQPRLAQGPGRKEGTAVTGALHRDDDRPGRAGPQVGEGEAQGPLDPPGHLERPGLRVHLGDVVVAAGSGVRGE